MTSNGALYILQRDVLQSHIGFMMGCPHTFGQVGLDTVDNTLTDHNLMISSSTLYL